MKQKLNYAVWVCAALAALATASCGGSKKKILIDGSSTVYPITEAIAEDFGKENHSAHVTVGISGTGGGFKRFCAGETDISDASRPIKKEEMEKCAQGKVEYVEIPVAYDGLAVLVHKDNAWVNELTVPQLKKIFGLEGAPKTWKDVNASWPDQPIKVYSPGKDSGTFDYFKEAILGKEGAMRADASLSEDDNVLVTGIAGDKGSIGYFGLAYYEENKDKLKDVPVVNPKTGKAVRPTLETVKSNEYAPLSRPLFIYVSKASLAKPEVRAFAEFYLKKTAELSRKVGYIPLEQSDIDAAADRLKNGQAGTAFGGKHLEGKTLAEIYRDFK